MSGNTKIEWADATFNPFIGCTKVSPECANCFAELLSKFRGWAEWGKGKPRHRTSEAYWRQPLKWNKVAELTKQRMRVFCASLADVFDAEVEQSWRDDIFELIDKTPMLDWLLLTKRPENILRMMPPVCGVRPNVWLGTSVGHPDTKWRIGDLVSVPAVVHFLSCEPLLADLGKVELHDIDWVIVGGESGGNARPMRADWARNLRNQCLREGVAFHFKQWGEFLDFEHLGERWNQLTERQRCNQVFVEGDAMIRVGKKAAGRFLDGRTWDELPTIQKCMGV
jgi:protein gp37